MIDRLNARMESELDRLQADGGHDREVRELRARLRHGCEVAHELHLVIRAAHGH
ncbi:hypothetical protein P8605_30960 [Streptomyces sp. T-3]|nr:hypothetical protein [Streptomyces sp. T-3]